MALQEIKCRKEVSCGSPARLSISPFAWGLRELVVQEVFPWVHGVAEPVCADGCYILILSSETSPCHFQLDRGEWWESGSWESHSGWVTLLSPNLLPSWQHQASAGASWGSSEPCWQAGRCWADTPALWPPSSPLSPGWGHLFCLFFIKQCLLSAYYVPGAALKTCGTPARETDKHTFLASWSYVLRFPFY